MRLSHFYLAGMTAASLALATFDAPYLPLVFFGLIGLTSGCTNVVIAAVLAELFGTTHLGKIRALAGAIMVVASAATPGAIGVLFDAGVSLEAICLGFVGLHDRSRRRHLRAAQSEGRAFAALGRIASGQSAGRMPASAPCAAAATSAPRSGFCSKAPVAETRPRAPSSAPASSSSARKRLRS